MVHPRALAIWPKFSVQSVEIQMQCADQAENSATNERPSEVPPFFRSNRSQRKLPFRFHKILLSSCTLIVPLRAFFFYPPMRLQVWNDWFETENFRKFQPKILANWQVPLLCKKLLDEASGKTFTVNGKSYNIHKSQINKLGWIQVVAENTCKVQERM